MFLLLVDGTTRPLRDILRPSRVAQKLAYTGIAFMDARMLDYIPAQGPADLVPVCLDIIREGRFRIDALVVEGHAWRDVGTVQSYFEAHRELVLAERNFTASCPIWAFLQTANILRMMSGAKQEHSCGALRRSAGAACSKKAASSENAIIWDDVTIAEGVHIRDASSGGNLLFMRAEKALEKKFRIC